MPLPLQKKKMIWVITVLPALGLVNQLMMDSFSFLMSERVFSSPEFLEGIFFVIIEFEVDLLFHSVH